MEFEAHSPESWKYWLDQLRHPVGLSRPPLVSPSAIDHPSGTPRADRRLSIVVGKGGEWHFLLKSYISQVGCPSLYLVSGCCYFINLMGKFAPSVSDTRMPINAWNCLPLYNNQC